MNIIYLVIPVLIGFGNVAGAEALSRARIKLIEQKTNLRARWIVDTTCDSFGDQAWSFGAESSQHHLITRDFPGVPRSFRSSWVFEQARSGRIQNLGYHAHWNPRPRFAPPVLAGDPDANWIVITDLEPDDRLALTVLSQRLPREKVLAVGVTVLDARAKAAGARELLDSLGWPDVPVLVGNGGPPSSYPNLPSNLAARTFPRVGRQRSRGSGDLQAFITESLESAAREKKRVNLLVLAPVTDVTNALLSANKYHRVQRVLNRVIVVGGWAEDGGERRSTYNWNMDPISANWLLNNINLTLVSSHLVKPAFGDGGSISAKTSPEIAARLNLSLHPALADFRVHAEAWDRHLVHQIPALREIIGPYAGRQFTPADVVAAALVTDPAIATRTQDNVHVHLDPDQKDQRGSLITLSANAGEFGGASVVAELNRERFMRQALEALSGLDCARGLR